MPPFSADVHQARLSYNNANVEVHGDGSLTAEEKAFLSRENIGEDNVAREASEIVGGWSNSAPNCSLHDTVEPDLDEIDLNGTSLPYEKLNIDSVVDALEEQQLYAPSESVYITERQWFRGYYYPPPPTRLATIPERKVRFAGTMWFADTFRDALEVYTIPHVREYTPDDKRKMWYTKNELSGMREACFRTAMAASQDTELYCPSYFRGLEHLIDQAIVLASFGLDATDETDGESSDSTSRRWDAISAVLDEQDHQRSICWNTHGVIYGGMMDPEKVRSVYTAKGKTKTSQSIALALASRDEASAREWLEENRNRVPEAYRDEDKYNDDNFHRSQTGSKELSLSAGGAKCVSVLDKLLTPFLDIRRGDIYQGMGEECFGEN